MELLSRFRGSLLGLAAGDALGAPVEFCAPGSFAPVVGMRGGGPFGLSAGFWTDDTSMALCLAESLIESDGFDSADQMRRYCRWYREGHLSSTGRCFDIGNTTAAALWRFEKTHEPCAGSTRADTAGNGSLMRLAPVPLFYCSDPRQVIERAADSSRTTHGATAAVDCCRYAAALMYGLIQGIRRCELLSDVYEPYAGCWTEAPLCPEVHRVAAGSFRKKQPPAIRGGGYVVEALEAALWAFWNHRGFADGALAAVNLGDDADSTGAIYGQLAGAYYGLTGIPEEWLRTLAHRYLLEGYALRLFEARFSSDSSSSPR